MSPCSTPDITQPYQGLQALVVDDHPVNARVLSILLRQLGMECTVVNDGAAAVNVVSQGQIDAVFMDYHMPVLDGFGATQMIRKLPAPLNETPVILVTADVCTSTQDDAVHHGVDAFVGKPVRLQELRYAIMQALHAHPISSQSLLKRATSAGSMATATEWRDKSVTSHPMRTLMINQQIFEELRDLIPDDQWPIMLDSLFAPESGDLDVLIEHLKRGDRTEIGEQAHKLKGASMLMGLSAMGEAAAQLEHCARRTNDAIDAEMWSKCLKQLALGSHAAISGLLKQPS